jgi:hypothetical protein
LNLEPFALPGTYRMHVEAFIETTLPRLAGWVTINKLFAR